MLIKMRYKKKYKKQSHKKPSLKELMLRGTIFTSLMIGGIYFIKWQEQEFIKTFLPYMFASCFLFLACWIFILFKERQKKKQWVMQQQSIRDLMKMDWASFERLVGEAFKKMGWKTQLNGQGGADGGVDLFVQKNGKKGIVQVKHWKGKVGASIVREQFGLQIHHKAQVTYIVALGGFTKDAIEFSHGKSIILLNGEQLLELLH